MSHHHFTSVEFENFGPIKRATLELTRLHALIGPNDSGKSFTLRGLNYAASLHQQRPWLAGTDATLAATKNGLRKVTRKDTLGWFLEGVESRNPPKWLETDWGPARVFRLDPDHLRAPQPLLMDSLPLDFIDERGLGLGALLDAVFARSKKTYGDIERGFIALFPTVEEFSLSTTNQGRRVGIKLRNGPIVGPEHMSEGMLYFLAFSLLPYLRPLPLLLVEEPENGLHPSRIAEVMRVLREISKTTQVVMATHSPLVVNELQPDEVTVVTRTETEGTKFTPIAQTANFEQRAKAFALGELWLSYADGVTEGPLFETKKAAGSK